MNSLILYSRSDDPVVVFGRELANVHPESIRTMHVDEFVEHLSSAGWPEVLRLRLPSSIAAEFRVDLIVNRLFTMEATQVSARLADLGLDERWFYARMMKYLDRGGRLAYDIGQRGVSRSLLPLYAQWYRVRHCCSVVSTPKFSYAFGAEHPDRNGLGDAIQKSVWSLFDWRVEHNISAGELRQHKFLVGRPKGTPIILYYMGNTCCERLYPNGYVEIQDGLCDQIISVCRSEFCSEAGELLLYVDNDRRVQFYAFSPFLHSAAQERGFNAQIAAWLNEPGNA